MKTKRTKTDVDEAKAAPAEYVFEVGIVNVMTHQAEWREMARYDDETIAQFVLRANRHCECRIRKEERPGAAPCGQRASRRNAELRRGATNENEH